MKVLWYSSIDEDNNTTIDWYIKFLWAYVSAGDDIFSVDLAKDNNWVEKLSYPCLAELFV